MKAADIDKVENLARAEARNAVSSLAGLVLRRTQERNYTRVMKSNLVIDQVMDTLAEIFGEALEQFSGPVDADAD